MSKAKAFEGGLSARRQEQRKGRTHASAQGRSSCLRTSTWRGYSTIRANSPRMHALLMIGTGVYVPPARGRRNRDAQAQKRSPRTTGRRGESYFWGDSSESAYKVPAARSHGAATPHPISRRRAACSPAFRGIWWPFALTLLLVEAARWAQSRSRRACSLASHTAHALAPHSCLPFPKRSAGWLRAG